MKKYSHFFFFICLKKKIPHLESIHKIHEYWRATWAHLHLYFKQKKEWLSYYVWYTYHITKDKGLVYLVKLISLFLLIIMLSISLMHTSHIRKLLMKELSGVQFCASLKSTICLLLSICLMSWKITCIQIATVGVQLFHCGSEEWSVIAQ